MLKFIKDKSLYKNLLFAGFTLVLLFFVWLKWLDVYTNHNDFIKVPNFNDTHLSNLDSFVAVYGLKYEIIDSVFDNSKQKGMVVNQDPLPNTDVKNNRRVYLTINSMKYRKVNFPDIFDLTLRQAVSKLQKNGLAVGELVYQPDIATNKVLAFKVSGVSIEIGQELYHGTTVDLVVGQGLSDEKVLIPNLLGLNRLEANITLKSSSLNIGLEYFNKNISDSNLAIIYKQYPQPSKSKKISIGSSLDLYFDFQKQDSL